MTVHDISPGFVIVFYTSNGHNHKHIIPISAPVDTGGGVFTVATKSAGAVGLIAAMATWATAIKAIFHNTSTLLYWELWTKSSPTADPVFNQTGDLSTVGGSGASIVPLGQVVFSYRTGLGNNGKAQFQETVIGVNQVLKPPYGSPINSVTAYMLGSQSIYAGRDEGFPISIPKVISKTNDFLRKKFLLDVS